MTAPGIAFLGTTFQNPVLLAAGTAGFGREVAGVIDLDTLGGIVTKAVTPEPRHGHPRPRVAEFRGGMLNAVGLANPGLEHAAAVELPWLTADGDRRHRRLRPAAKPARAGAPACDGSSSSMPASTGSGSPIWRIPTSSSPPSAAPIQSR